MRTDLFPVAGPWPGSLAVMPRPRGGDWLEDEVRAWRTAGVEGTCGAAGAIHSTNGLSGLAASRMNRTDRSRNTSVR